MKVSDTLESDLYFIGLRIYIIILNDVGLPVKCGLILCLGEQALTYIKEEPSASESGRTSERCLGFMISNGGSETSGMF